MTDPCDVDDCFLAIYHAHELLDIKQMEPKDFQEFRLGLLSVARKNMRQLLHQKRDVEDGFDPKNHRR